MVSPGRPRKASVHGDVVRAAGALVAELGYGGVTVDLLVERAGTTKPAFYRRFPGGVADVVPHILGERYGPDDDIDTGSLEGDLREVQRRQRRMFTDPVVLRGLPGWLAAVDVDPERGRPFVAGFLAPRRAHTSVILARAEARGEIPGGWDPDWISDVLSGPLVTRAMLPGMPPVDELLVEQTVQAALQALGAEAETHSSAPSAPGDEGSG